MKPKAKKTQRYIPNVRSISTTRKKANRKQVRSRNGKTDISLRNRSNKIHDSIETAIRKIGSGEMNRKSAREILQRIHIVQKLLRAAEREIENWLARQ